MNGVEDKKRWNGRRFTSYLLLFSFFSVLVTGAFCYIKPKGSIAHWTQWSLLGLTKEGWEGTHMALSVLFLAAALLHVWFNWNALAGYLRNAFRFRGPGLGEAALSLLLVLVFWVGVLAKVPPVAFVPLGHSYFKKKAWTGNGTSTPPWDGAEKTGLQDLSLDFGLNFPVLRKKLQAAGLAPRSPEESLKRVAERYGLSPAEVIYRALGDVKGLKPSHLLQRLAKEARAE